MKPYLIQMYVYAESREEAEMAQDAMFNYVCSMRREGIMVKADRLISAVEKFGENAIVKQFFK